MGLQFVKNNFKYCKLFACIILCHSANITATKLKKLASKWKMKVQNRVPLLLIIYFSPKLEDTHNTHIKTYTLDDFRIFI